MNDRALQPEDIARLFVEAWNQRDAHSLAELFVEDADFVNVVGLWWRKRENIFNAHDYGLKIIFKHSTLTLRYTRLRQLSPKLAVVHAKMQLENQTPYDKEEQAGKRENIFTFVVAQQKAGNWLCVAAHNTDVVPGMETNLVTEKGIRPVDYRKTSS